MKQTTSTTASKDAAPGPAPKKTVPVPNAAPPVSIAQNSNVTQTTTPPPTQTATPTTKSSAPTKSTSTTSTATTKGTPAPQKEESKEEKKVNPTPSQEITKETPQQAEPRKINLTQFMNVAEECRNNNKTAIFVDPEGNSFTFCKYKSTLIDFPEFKIQEGLGQTDKNQFIEATRVKLVNNLRSGGQVALYMDGIAIVDLDAFFAGQKFWQVDKLFSNEEVIKQEWHKKQLLLPEEDKDVEGNQGMYFAKQDFHMVIVLQLDFDSSKNIRERLGLKTGPFEVIHIVPN